MPRPFDLQSGLSVEQPSAQISMQRSLDQEAFDIALQNADQRHSMGDADRLVRASADALQAMSLESNARAVREPSDSVDIAPSYLCVRESSPNLAYVTQQSVSSQLASGVHCGVSDSVLHLLQKRLSAQALPAGTTLSLELLDDPSGVLGIDLTRTDDLSWEINVSMAGCDSPSMSDDLIQALRKNGFSVAALSIEVRAA